MLSISQAAKIKCYGCECPFFHRMGDVGYFDDDGRLWFCGRKAHCVHTSKVMDDGIMMMPLTSDVNGVVLKGMIPPVCVEGVINHHASVFRSALVGVGTAPDQTPVLVCQHHQFNILALASRHCNYRYSALPLKTISQSLPPALLHQQSFVIHAFSDYNYFIAGD